MRHTLGVLVENRPGVLNHISGLISRRAFNIESITAGKSEVEDITRLTISFDIESVDDLDQIICQLEKLVDVIKIVNLPDNAAIMRELALIKVKAEQKNRSDIVDIVDIFRANIVNVNPDSLVIELTGETEKIDAICEVLKGHGIIEIVRTGRIALSRFSEAAREDK